MTPLPCPGQTSHPKVTSQAMYSARIPTGLGYIGVTNNTSVHLYQHTHYPDPDQLEPFNQLIRWDNNKWCQCDCGRWNKWNRDHCKWCGYTKQGIDLPDIPMEVARLSTAVRALQANNSYMGKLWIDYTWKARVKHKDPLYAPLEVLQDFLLKYDPGSLPYKSTGWTQMRKKMNPPN